MAGQLATFPILTWDLLDCPQGPGYLWVPLHYYQVPLIFPFSFSLVAEGLDIPVLSWLCSLLSGLPSGPLAILWQVGFAYGPRPGPWTIPIQSSC